MRSKPQGELQDSHYLGVEEAETRLQIHTFMSTIHWVRGKLLAVEILQFTSTNVQQTFNRHLPLLTINTTR